MLLSAGEGKGGQIVVRSVHNFVSLAFLASFFLNPPRKRDNKLERRHAGFLDSWIRGLLFAGWSCLIDFLQVLLIVYYCWARTLSPGERDEFPLSLSPPSPEPSLPQS